jgi:predicted ATPase
MKMLNSFIAFFDNKQEIVLDFDDSRLHTIVGANGSGKTRLLKLIGDKITQGYGISDAYYNLDFNTCVDKRRIDLKPQFQKNGFDLAGVLDYMFTHVNDDFSYLNQKLRQIFPYVQEIEMYSRKSLFDGSSIFSEFSLRTNDGKFRSYDCSEGVVLVIGLLTALLNPFRHNLILLDNIDKNLHSTAQRALIDVFKEILQQNLNLQIICSTYSPYVIDKFNQSQVYVLNNKIVGQVTCKRLDKHPDAEWAKQTLTTGEFWDSIGEDW